MKYSAEFVNADRLRSESEDESTFNHERSNSALCLVVLIIIISIKVMQNATVHYLFVCFFVQDSAQPLSYTRVSYMHIYICIIVSQWTGDRDNTDSHNIISKEGTY